MSEVLDDRLSAEGGVKSVMTALALLESFTGSEELGISEVARVLGVAKSTAHRLITTLRTRGFVERNPRTGRYRLGLQMYELGVLAGNRMKLCQAALPVLEELRERTRGTVHLGVADQHETVYLERLQSLRGLQLVMSMGMRLPSHATSCGRVMAAYDPKLAKARRKAGLPALTEQTITSAAVFDEDLRSIQRRGYAVSVDVLVVGLSSVGAPIFDREGRPCAAVSVVDVTPQVTPNVEKLGRLVIQAAQVIAPRIMI